MEFVGFLISVGTAIGICWIFACIVGFTGFALWRLYVGVNSFVRTYQLGMRRVARENNVVRMTGA